MYIFNRMRELYETTTPDTIDYILSRYILMNIHRISELSVSNISANTSISKSAVSKFFKTVSNNHGFSQFIASLELELQCSSLDYHKIVIDALSSKNMEITLLENKKYIMREYVNQSEINQLAHILIQKKHLLFWGNDSKKAYFDTLINCLIINGKDAKFVSWMYSAQQTFELSKLDSSSAMIIVEPTCTFYDFKLRYSMSVEMPDNIVNIDCEKIYIGRTSKDGNDFKLINLNTIGHCVVDDMLLTYFVSQLLLAYLRLKDEF